jgi:hypothetical protein
LCYNTVNQLTKDESMACGTKGKKAGDTIGQGRYVTNVVVSGEIAGVMGDDGVSSYEAPDGKYVSMAYLVKSEQSSYLNAGGTGQQLDTRYNPRRPNLASALLSTLAEIDQNPDLVYPPTDDFAELSFSDEDIHEGRLEQCLLDVGVVPVVAHVLGTGWKVVETTPPRMTLQRQGMAPVRIYKADNGLWVIQVGERSPADLTNASLRRAFLQSRTSFVEGAVQKATMLSDTAALGDWDATRSEAKAALPLLPTTEKKLVTKALAKDRKDRKALYEAAPRTESLDLAEVHDELNNYDLQYLSPPNNQFVSAGHTFPSAKAALQAQIRAMPDLSEFAREALAHSILAGYGKSLRLHWGHGELNIDYSAGFLMMPGEIVPASSRAVLRTVVESYYPGDEDYDYYGDE